MEEHSSSKISSDSSDESKLEDADVVKDDEGVFVVGVVGDDEDGDADSAAIAESFDSDDDSLPTTMDFTIDADAFRSRSYGCWNEIIFVSKLVDQTDADVKLTKEFWTNG